MRLQKSSSCKIPSTKMFCSRLRGTVCLTGLCLLSFTNTFKTRLDKFWHNRDITYDFKAQLRGTGSPSKVIYEEFWQLFCYKILKAGIEASIYRHLAYATLRLSYNVWLFRVLDISPTCRFAYETFRL